MLFFEVLPFTTLASSVNGKTSKKSQTPPSRFCTFFFEVLPFTDDASVVNGKTSKKSIQKRRGGFWCV